MQQITLSDKTSPDVIFPRGARRSQGVGGRRAAVRAEPAARRQLAGLSQEELGERASLHRTEIGKLEKGERLARIDTLVRLAGAMAIAPEELIEGIHWTPAATKVGTFTFGTPPRQPDD